MPKLNRIEIRRREAEEAFIALNTYIRAAMGVFRLYCFIVSTTHYPRPELSPNPNYYQTQVDAVNRLVNGNEVDCHEQLRKVSGLLLLISEGKDYYWVVFVGHKPGIYTTWGEAQL
ncbi:hypothetical protein RHMOL_Rhmol10G0226700 [Rhododendron molle]|uniref:Uncharacterized protein n=1 Tax=Rhododendron molle TaxID=49168 RepID=A0ACC0M4T1_RHOML|nr:hypothetical protein RHMOL_Rhmol10G0226700 [Rhododendron molle]